MPGVVEAPDSIPNMTKVKSKKKEKRIPGGKTSSVEEVVLVLRVGGSYA